MSLKTIQYQTRGTCCKLMNIVLDDNIIKDAEFIGGCPGNLEGIRQLIKGMDVNEAASRLKGIRCGAKPTSCPDQLASCLIEYMQTQPEEAAAKHAD